MFHFYHFKTLILFSALSMTQRRIVGDRQTWPWFPALFASSQPWAASGQLSPHIPAKTGPFFAPINVFGLNWYNFIVTQHDRIMSHWLVSAFYGDLQQAYSCLDPLVCQHQFIVQKDINILAVCAWHSLNKKYCKYLLYFYILLDMSILFRVKLTRKSGKSSKILREKNCTEQTLGI